MCAKKSITRTIRTYWVAPSTNVTSVPYVCDDHSPRCNIQFYKRTPAGHTFEYAVALVYITSRNCVWWTLAVYRKDTQCWPMGKAGIHLNASRTIAQDLQAVHLDSNRVAASRRKIHRRGAVREGFVLNLGVARVRYRTNSKTLHRIRTLVYEQVKRVNKTKFDIEKLSRPRGTVSKT